MRKTDTGSHICFPGDTSPATKLLFEEAAVPSKKMSRKEVSDCVIVKNFQHCWQRVKGQTLSLYTGLQVGHYKAALFDIVPQEKWEEEEKEDKEEEDQLDRNKEDEVGWTTQPCG